MAIPALALLVAAALALVGIGIGIVRAGLNWTSGDAAAAIPLAEPAPALAGGLPKRDEPVHSIVIQQLISRFARRFTAASGSLAGRPSAIYREPGTVDLTTDEAGWVMYLGHNSAASLGAPASTVGRVMALLIGKPAPGVSWPASAGPRGGSARCGNALFGTTAVALCVWATDHTIGALMSPIADTRGKELGVLMPLMRLDLQPGPSTHHEPDWTFGSAGSSG